MLSKAFDINFLTSSPEGQGAHLLQVRMLCSMRAKDSELKHAQFYQAQLYLALSSANQTNPTHSPWRSIYDSRHSRILL
jgi:hypothetical protein